MNNNKFIYIITIIWILTSCESRIDKTKHLICGNGDYKFWYCNAHHDINYRRFVYFDKEGRHQLYGGYDDNKRISPVNIDDVPYPNFWELENDSTIIYRWEKGGKHKMKSTIVHLSKDLLIERIEVPDSVIIDTLRTIPDSLKHLPLIPIIEEHRQH